MHRAILGSIALYTLLLTMHPNNNYIKVGAYDSVTHAALAVYICNNKNSWRMTFTPHFFLKFLRCYYHFNRWWTMNKILASYLVIKGRKLKPVYALEEIYCRSTKGNGYRPTIDTKHTFRNFMFLTIIYLLFTVFCCLVLVLQIWHDPTNTYDRRFIMGLVRLWQTI